MRNPSQLISPGVDSAVRMPAYGLPVVRELPLALEPVAPETFGGLTSTPTTTQ